MTAPTLDEQVNSLRTLREDCAGRSRDLAERELTGRLLRLEIEVELQQRMAKTQAEKEAKADARYVAQRETIRLTFERERVLAEAEASLLNVKLQLAVLERVGT